MPWTTPLNHSEDPTIQQLMDNVSEKLDLVQELLSLGPKLTTKYCVMQSYLYATMGQLSYLERQLMAALYQLQYWMETTKSASGLTRLRTLKTRSDGWLICLQLTSLSICLGEMLENVSLALPETF